MNPAFTPWGYALQRRVGRIRTWSYRNSSYLFRGIVTAEYRRQHPCMRVNLLTKSNAPTTPSRHGFTLSLTIRPACGLPGDFEYETNSAALLRMLRQQTDLPASVLQRFEGNLYSSPSARLLGVDLSERLLTEIGYFVD